MRPARSASPSGWSSRSSRNGSGSAATGIRVAASRSTSSTRPASPRRASGSPTRGWPHIVAAADLKSLIVDKALALGFDVARVAPGALAERYRLAFDNFLANGRQGDMDWLARTPERRTDPRGLWPEVKSILMLAANYGPAIDPMARLGRRDRATISVYAQNRDYHDILKKRLKELGRFIAAETGTELKVFVDTAPVMEKPDRKST